MGIALESSWEYHQKLKIPEGPFLIQMEIGANGPLVQPADPKDQPIGRWSHGGSHKDRRIRRHDSRINLDFWGLFPFLSTIFMILHRRIAAMSIIVRETLGIFP